MSAPYSLIGTPFSTFTRTVALGLHYKGLRFEQVRTPPHAPLTQQYHPFGLIPTLVIHELDGQKVDDIPLRESQAIARFIDRIAPEPSLNISPGDGGGVLPEKMWELVSFIASIGFRLIESGVVKPRVRAKDAGLLSEAEVRSNIKEEVEKVKTFLKEIEALMSPEGFAYGSKPSWADFFLYPLLADLQTLPEWDEVTSPRIKSWFKHVDELPVAQATKPGTLSVGARP